ncbi:hypothetical protein G9A89_018442 [Geosiphon pyriformis]|nr:hypothetical protein G9A89_018442 [Geosiphon pyriformis]
MSNTGHLILVRFLFKCKILVIFLGLYAGTSAEIRFGLVSEINSLIAKAVNSSSFVVLGGDFNENGSKKSASYKFCLDIELVNLFQEHSLVKTSTWDNSRGILKVIDFIFVSSNLASAVVLYIVNDMLKFFNTDHKSISVLKFKLENANKTQWVHFKKLFLAGLLTYSTKFQEVKNNMHAADVIFSRHWFSEYDCSKNRQSSKFFKLKLLVSRIIKAFSSGDLLESDRFVKVWSAVDNEKTSKLAGLVLNGAGLSKLLKHLLIVKKEYWKSKYYESRASEDAAIKKTINYYMENFCSDKGRIIKSVLEHLFCKVVLNHLVVDNKLVIEPGEIKLKYMSLNYVDDCAFFGVMKEINMEKLSLVVGNLPNKKAAGLSRIPNEGSGFSLEAAKFMFNTECDSYILEENIAYNKFNVLCGDNFLVLKGISTQSPIFAVGSIVRDALKKNKELWLVLQNMHKAYNSFISFFGGIHESQINRVMMDFGLLNGYKIHNGLDQSKVKRHEHLCSYYIDIQFVARTDRVETVRKKTSFLAASAFVDGTIWVKSSQALTQYILNIASEFFIINDILINNDKTVAILINQGVKDVLLLINGLLISIAKKNEFHRYLGIFLFTESIFKPSLAQAHKNVKFFSNMMLKKAIMNKQFFYLVSVVLQPIVGYWIQFSFVSLDSLKAKAALLHDFSNEVLYHLSLYGLKPFEQIQSEGKLASLVSFSNKCSILGCLFEHRFLDLQVLEWFLLNFLQFPVKLCVSPINNFLARIVRIFLENELSLVNNLSSAFRGSCKFLIFNILEKSMYYDSVLSLKHFGIAFGNRLLDKKGVVMDWKTFRQWKRLDPRGPVLYWFTLVFKFMNNVIALEAGSAISFNLPVLNVLDFSEFLDVHSSLLDVWSDYIKVYTDRPLKSAGSAKVTCGAAAYFSVANVSIKVRVFDLLLALKCVPASYNITLYLNSQSAIDAYVFETSLTMPDFHRHSEILGNIKADELANKTTVSSLTLLVGIWKWFLVAEGTAVSNNTHYFVCNIYQSICHAYWEAGPGYDVIPSIMLKEVD